jgi:hypothetical protein
MPWSYLSNKLLEFTDKQPNLWLAEPIWLATYLVNILKHIFTNHIGNSCKRQNKEYLSINPDKHRKWWKVTWNCNMVLSKETHNEGHFPLTDTEKSLWSSACMEVCSVTSMTTYLKMVFNYPSIFSLRVLTNCMIVCAQKTHRQRFVLPVIIM